MQTYEDKISIENRVLPRSRMLYITPPYTALLEDVNLAGADMAVATQKNFNQEMALAEGVVRMQVRHLGRAQMPEVGTGALVTHNV